MSSRIFTTRVAGTTYENRQELLAELSMLNQSDYPPCRLEPEPTNAYDPNAIKVMVAIAPGEVKHAGYIPKDLAKQIAPYLEGEALMCSIVEINGGFVMFDGSIANRGLVIRVELPERK